MPKVWPRGFFPEGFSVRNLRRLGPSKGARTLALRGFAAAKKHFPSLRRDPSQLRPLELITIDDFELDALCVFPGDRARGLRPQIGRIAGLLAIDVATRKKLVWGIGQRLEREETAPDGTVRTIRSGIARVDVQLLIHQLFATYGLPDYQVTLLVENASAAISPELQLCLETLFEGRVKIERTGLVDHKTLTNGFAERGGKPWEKGWIESTFNQLWNTLGGMKGYKGSNQRLNAPGDLDQAIRYTKVLIGQGERAENLPPEAIAQLRLPFMSPDEASAAFAWAVEVNEQRDNHRYIGFRSVVEYRIQADAAPVPFAHLALLSTEAQLAAEPVERMETVAERWAAQLAGVTLTPLPSSVLALLLLTPKRVTYRNHAVTMK
jgi:transposase InsO family protein